MGGFTLDFCRKLERERDEARELSEQMFRQRAEALKEIHNQFVEYDKLFDESEKIRLQRDEARTEMELWRDGNIMHQIHRDELEKVERERDEARELHRKALREREATEKEVDAMLERARKVERERDKWEETASLYCKNSEFNREMREKVERERDEAREAIPDGEWVAYEDHRKVHDAASRLLVAINKQLPIGCFTLISHEYYRLQNAIYGKDGAK
jgi:hypothetical protein